MSKELDKLKEYMTTQEDNKDLSFSECSKVFLRANENLKNYIERLKGKRVLCVSSSGDHLLNSLYAGANEIDTFDINIFSPLYQELSIYAIKYLTTGDAYCFLSLLLPNYYWKFNEKLPPHLKEFFDYVFTNYDYNTILEKLINNELHSSIANSHFGTLDKLKALRSRLSELKHRHIVSDLYSLPDKLDRKYDVIYLSNILEYEKDFDRYFDIVRRLKNSYLNEGGELFYNYLWGKSPEEDLRFCYRRSKNDYISYEEIQRNKDIINTTQRVLIPSVINNHLDENGLLLPDMVLKTYK